MMETKSDFRNELFQRNEMSFELDSESNPSFEEMKIKVSELVGKPVENVEVYNIKNSFGSKKFVVDAFVYDSEEKLNEIKALSLTKKQKEAIKKAEEDKKKAEEEAKKAEEEAKANAEVEEVKEDSSEGKEVKE